MKLIAKIHVPPCDYMIFSTSVTMKKGDVQVYSNFIPGKEIILHDSLSDREMLRKLSRELFRAWNYHWPGPMNGVRKQSFQTWIMKTFSDHFPDIVEKMDGRKTHQRDALIQQHMRKQAEMDSSIRFHEAMEEMDHTLAQFEHMM